MMTSIERSILYSCNNGIARITLNRPNHINAFNIQMRDELYETLRLFNDDSLAEVGIIEGSGLKGFCSGADLTEFGTAPSQIIARNVRWERDLWGLFLKLDKPIVAKLHGYVIGSGVEIASLCDVRISSENSVFKMPEVALGLIPAAGGTQTLSRLIGQPLAMDMLVTGRLIKSQEALKIGLIDYCVSSNEVENMVNKVVNTLKNNNNVLTRTAKHLVRESLDLSLEQGMRIESIKAIAALTYNQ
jgi:enoyl-CoA hydratase/carnithine racemase